MVRDKLVVQPREIAASIGVISLELRFAYMCVEPLQQSRKVNRETVVTRGGSRQYRSRDYRGFVGLFRS